MFIEIKSNSQNPRKFIHGVATNDADYFTQYKGKTCPYYSRWRKMLERCYSVEWQESKPTYKECSVCNEWLLFSNFKSWMINQDWIGKELDKDIINNGNKTYSPENCAFVSRKVNLLIQIKPSIK
tara:strand:- start:71 stop:445 length:375 start_codon:yes stop_codon:yes gene_type:complete